jgi:hypothetical protein
MGRPGQPAEVGPSYVFLASEVRVFVCALVLGLQVLVRCMCVSCVCVVSVCMYVVCKC